MNDSLLQRGRIKWQKVHYANTGQRVKGEDISTVTAEEGYGQEVTKRSLTAQRIRGWNNT